MRSLEKRLRETESTARALVAIYTNDTSDRQIFEAPLERDGRDGWTEVRDALMGLFRARARVTLARAP